MGVDLVMISFSAAGVLIDAGKAHREEWKPMSNYDSSATLLFVGS